MASRAVPVSLCPCVPVSLCPCVPVPYVPLSLCPSVPRLMLWDIPCQLLPCIPSPSCGISANNSLCLSPGIVFPALIKLLVGHKPMAPSQGFQDCPSPRRARLEGEKGDIFSKKVKKSIFECDVVREVSVLMTLLSFNHYQR